MEQALKHISDIRKERKELSKWELRKKCGLHERHNPLLDLQVDLYRYMQDLKIYNTMVNSYDLQEHMHQWSVCTLFCWARPAARSDWPTIISTETTDLRQNRSFRIFWILVQAQHQDCRHFKSVHGHDFKLSVQVALFIVWEYLDEVQKRVRLTVKMCVNMHANIQLAPGTTPSLLTRSTVNLYAGFQFILLSDILPQWSSQCWRCLPRILTALHGYKPEFLHKPKSIYFYI